MGVGKLTFIFTIFVVGFCIRAYAEIRSHEVNYFVIQTQAEPFQIVSSENKQSGVITDLVYEIFKNSNQYKVNTFAYPFKRMFQILESKSVKDWVTFGAPVWRSVQKENLSKEPIIHVKHFLVLKKGTKFKYKGIDSLSGKKVVLLHGYDYPGFEKYLDTKKIIEKRVKSFAAAFEAIADDKADVFVGMRVRILYNLQKLNRSPNHFEFVDFSDVIPAYNVYLALDPGMDSSLENYINNRVAILKQNGFIKKLHVKYFGSQFN